MSLYKLNKDMLIKIILKIEENEIQNMTDIELDKLYYKILFERNKRNPKQQLYYSGNYESYLPN